jgi:raffinose/stachyose/melibiose transport system substrate-binding protein
MKKKTSHVISSIIALFLILSLAACSNKSGSNDTNTNTNTNTNDTAKKKNPVKMKFLYIWPEHKELMEKSIDMFMEKNEHINVDVNVVPWNEVDRTLQTQIAANDVPDVFFQWTHQMATWVELGAVKDLTPYLEADKEWRDSFWGDGMFEMGKIKGSYYNVPFRGTSFVIGYNKSIFNSLGLERPKTLQDMENVMEQLLKNNITPFALYGRPSGGTVAALNSIFSNFANIQTGLVNDPMYKTGRLMVDDNDLTIPIYCAKKMKDWLTKGYLGKSAMGIGREEAQNQFINGKAAMFWMNNNEISFLEKGLGSEIGVFAFPGPAGVDYKYVFGGFDGFSVSNTTKNIEESIMLVKHLTGKDVQQLWADAGSAMVVKNITYKNPTVTDLVSYLEYVGKYDVFPDFNQGDYKSKAEDLTVEFLLTDKMTPEEFVKKMRNNSLKSMEDAGVKPIRPSIDVKKIDIKW